jgi:hypothetical protein
VIKIFYNINQFKTKNIEYITKLDIKNLQKACLDYVTSMFTNKPNTYNTYNDGSNTFVNFNPTESKVRYSFNNEIYNYLYQQDLHIFLGTSKDYFNCIIHNDKDNQASIYQKDNGNWIYKCFNENCPFKIGDINKLTECLTGLSRPDSLEFLMQVYGIVLEKNEWQIKQEKMVDANIEFLLDIDNIKINYPELYKRIYNYIPQLLILHEFAKRNLTLEQAMNSNLVTFSAPVRQLSNALIKKNKSGDINQISKRNNILTFIGLLIKLSDDMILPNQLQELRDYAISQNYNNYLNFYAIPSYNYDVLNNAENKAIEFKQNGMTVKGFSKEMIDRGYGKNEVQNVYPRQINLNDSGLHEGIFQLLHNKIISEIKDKGYCIEKEIYTNGYFIRSIKRKLKYFDEKDINKKKVELVFKICLPELLNSYSDLRRGRLTNRLKEIYNINIKGNPNILYKEIK